MKNILNYETAQEFAEAEGYGQFVTSIVPGVAYMKEHTMVFYNKSPKITFKTNDPNIPFNVTFNGTATCQEIWDLIIETMGGTEPAPPFSVDTYKIYGDVYHNNQTSPGEFFTFVWNNENYNKTVCEKVQMFSDNINPLYEPAEPIPSLYSSETGKFDEFYYGCTIELRASIITSV